MKRFFWIPFLLLLALFSATLLNWPAVHDSLAALHESWDKHTAYFHIVLQHDELNEVESLLARADSFAFEQDKAELRACIAELKSQMLILSEMQEISIRNIL